MKTPKYKHLTLEDRFVIQEYLDFGYNATKIALRVNKTRRTISKEVFKHRFITCISNFECDRLSSFPYVCNACEKKRRCKLQQYRYDASIAHNEYVKTLKETRSVVRISKDEVAAVNDVIAPLMVHKNHSVNQVYIEHPELLPFSKSTFYRYIDLGLLNVRNIDLQRKVRYKVKKEYDYSRENIDKAYREDRTYEDFKDFMDLHPMACVVEMDTVIGTSGGKGGKCFLTILWRQYNLMLIFLLPYKRREYVIKTFHYLQDLLGPEEFSRLFQVILTDNGSEFTDPESIEYFYNTGEHATNIFYCDSHCSWQKGTLEKNHEYIRYVLPKGTSFASLTQEDCDLLASHINSVPRESLNKNCPYDMAITFFGQKNMDKLNISRVPYDDINLSIRLLKK